MDGGRGKWSFLLILQTQPGSQQAMKKIAIIFLTSLATFTTSAQLPETLKVTPIGRVLMDGAFYAPDGDGLTSGVAVPDVRLGAKFAYQQWNGKIDVSYSYGKVKMKDVFLQYNPSATSYIRAGYFCHHYGLNSQVSSSMVPAMEWLTVDEFFSASVRNLGVMYVRSAPRYFLGVSGIIDAQSLTEPANEQGKVSYGGVGRLIARPLTGTAGTVHLGVSGWIQSALHQEDNPEGYFDFSAKFPTRVCKTVAIEADVTDARSAFKFSPELLLSRGRLALESQYYYMSVARRDRSAYKAQGFYAMLRGIVHGAGYSYDAVNAMLDTPRPGSLELTGAFNYIDGNDRHSGICPGRMNDTSVTLSYYINRYLTARMRYSYTYISDSPIYGDRHVNIVQARIQFKF